MIACTLLRQPISERHRKVSAPLTYLLDSDAPSVLAGENRLHNLDDHETNQSKNERHDVAPLGLCDHLDRV